MKRKPVRYKNPFTEEKKAYEEIEIPQELRFMVKKTIAEERKRKAIKQRARMIKAAGSVAALFFLVLAIGVNSSYVFAKNAGKIPVIKTVAKVLTVRNYEKEMAADEELQQNLSDAAAGTPAEASDISDMQESVVEETLISTETGDLKGMDLWVAELTLEKLKGITALYTPGMQVQDTILLAELPGADIHLYGYYNGEERTGVALRAGDVYKCYNWTYMNSSGKLPELTFADNDGDGKEELIICLYNKAAEEPAKSEEAQNAGEDAIIEETGEGEEAPESETPETVSGNNAEGSPKPTDAETKPTEASPAPTAAETKQAESSSPKPTDTDMKPTVSPEPEGSGPKSEGDGLKPADKAQETKPQNSPAPETEKEDGAEQAPEEATPEVQELCEKWIVYFNENGWEVKRLSDT